MITTEWLRDTRRSLVQCRFAQGKSRLKSNVQEPADRRRFVFAKALGMDCSFEATGTTDTEIMREFIDHAGSAHTMDLLTADMIYRIQQAIKK